MERTPTISPQNKDERRASSSAATAPLLPATLATDVLLLSTYELGRQPFGLASPAAWLRRAGARVTCADLSIKDFPAAAAAAADLVAFFLPMHTATRLAAPLIPRIRELNPNAHICYGLYGPTNAAYLKSLGVQTVIGGEFETGLLRLYDGLSRDRSDPGAGDTHISLDRQQFEVPDRSGLPALSRYAELRTGDGQPRIVGYTEASRGCKHRCRHCPVVPVYDGVFRIVQADIVLADVARQVEAGAGHITFGDPDFFNGIGHAVTIVEGLHERFPELSYDVTIKIEHLLKYADRIPCCVTRDALLSPAPSSRAMISFSNSWKRTTRGRILSASPHFSRQRFRPESDLRHLFALDDDLIVHRSARTHTRAGARRQCRRNSVGHSASHSSRFAPPRAGGNEVNPVTVCSRQTRLSVGASGPRS